MHLFPPLRNQFGLTDLTYNLYIIVICCYVFISALNGFCEMAFSRGFMGVYFLVIIVLSLYYLLSEAKKLDYLFLLFVVILIVASLLQDYEFALFRDGLNYIWLMLFFFLGRFRISNSYSIIQYGLLVYIVVGIAALYLFFAMPSWYYDFKVNGWWNIIDTGQINLEMIRLSAFWKYPYWISYGGAICFTYIVVQHINKNSKFHLRDVLLLVFLSVVVILAQQRVAIVWIVMLILYYLTRESFLKKDMSTVIFIVLMLSSIYTLSLIVSSDYIDRYFFKFEQVAEGNFMRERTEIFSSFFNKEISFWGDGLGRYGHFASSIKQKAITDQGYMKILYENGVFGVVGFSFFVLYSLIRGLKRIKYNLFEILVIIFFMVSMFGSNSIFGRDSHAAIFWFCLGHLSNSQNLKTKIS